MLRSLLYALTERLPARYINHDGRPYLERYYLCTLGSRRFYIHRFVDSDPDGVHAHPFLYSWSLILAGWYWEDRWAKRYRRQWVNKIGPNDFHRVVLPDNGKDVWTLFSHTPREKPWGFMRPIKEGVHGPEYTYVPQSDPEDPAMSQWYLTAPKGRELREKRRIPLGRNARGWTNPNASVETEKDSGPQMG